MKLKHIILASVSACTLGVTSCDLNISPDSYIADEFFFQDEAQVNTAVIGCYSGMRIPLEYEWALTELRSDNSRLGNSKTTNEVNNQLSALDLSVMNPSNQNIRSYWETTYQNINNCNTILIPENLLAVENESKRMQFEGEALFIRSYHYFNLVRLFGPIFIVTENISVSESLKKDRSAVGDVYAQIINDLKTSVDRLTDVTYANADLGRATVLAAKGLLAKVYLTLGRYEEARPLLQSIVDAKGETLVPYADVFDIDKEMSSEIIFTVRYKAGNLGIGSSFANAFAPLNSGTCVIIGSGDGKNYPTTELINLYGTGDKRKDVTLAENYIDDSKANPIINEAYVKKYLSPVTVRYDAENDWPILRYADILLMYAEVLNELDGPSAGSKYLNMVRKRAGLSDINSSEMNTRYAFRTAIDKERRLELAFENQRWFDLLRWGKAQDVVNEHIHHLEWSFYSTYSSAPGYMQDYQLILPIPQSVIDNNPGVITQNPNY